MAHGIFEELRSKDLILRICPHGARPLRTRGNRPPRALIAFREKPPSFAVRRIVHERPARLQESRAVVRDGIRIGKAVTRNLERLAGLLDAPGFLQRLREAPVPVLVEGKNLHGLPIARDRLVPFLLVPELLAEERPRVVVARIDRDGLAQMRHGLVTAALALRVPGHVVMSLRRARDLHDHVGIERDVVLPDAIAYDRRGRIRDDDREKERLAPGPRRLRNLAHGGGEETHRETEEAGGRKGRAPLGKDRPDHEWYVRGGKERAREKAQPERGERPSLPQREREYGGQKGAGGTHPCRRLP